MLENGALDLEAAVEFPGVRGSDEWDKKTKSMEPGKLEADSSRSAWA